MHMTRAQALPRFLNFNLPAVCVCVCACACTCVCGITDIYWTPETS